MIGRLQGILLSKDEQTVLLDVAGVGYEVEVPASIVLTLPAPGSPLVLHTHLSIREDAHYLYGFVEQRDRELFRVLIKVNGVGPKLALGLLSSLESQALVGCVMRNDISALIKLPGIGRKTAERLVVELRDRLKHWELQHGEGPATAQTAASLPRTDRQQEAEVALVGLGYKPQEAARVLVQLTSRLDQESEEPTTELLIRQALRELSKARV